MVLTHLVSLVNSGVCEVGFEVFCCRVAGYVNSGGVTGGLLVLLVCKHTKTNTVRMPLLQLSSP